MCDPISDIKYWLSTEFDFSKIDFRKTPVDVLNPIAELALTIIRPLAKRGNLVNFIVERLATVLIYSQ